MKVEIESKEKNSLLHRTDISFKVENAEKTPSRKDLREKIAALAVSKPELLVLGSLRHKYGTMQVFGSARVYDTIESLERIELLKAKRKNFPEKYFVKEEKKE